MDTILGCVDVDECTMGLSVCDLYADCSNNQGSYECTCIDGFRGNGRQCINVDDCQLGYFSGKG